MSDELRFDTDQLIEAMRFIELRPRRRPTALRDLAEAAGLADEGVNTEDILEAIEEREAAAQTVIAPGFATPHAFVNWNGGCRIVVGRSREGVDYGVGTEGRIHLIVLLLVGRLGESQYMTILSHLAELFVSEEFRNKLVQAPDIRTLERTLREYHGVQVALRPTEIPKISSQVLRQGVQLAEAISAETILLVVDRPEAVPWDVLGGFSGQLIVVTKEGDELGEDPRPKTRVIEIPQQSLGGVDRVKLGMLIAGTEGLLGAEDSLIVSVVSSDGRQLDSVRLSRANNPLRKLLTATFHRKLINSGVLFRVLTIAAELAAEGREGHSVGTLFVIGDTARVRKYAQQMVLNPFYGFSNKLRNILDPSLTETIKEFAQIDGAFLIRSDGTVYSAGTYLSPARAGSVSLPPGLGTRHRTAAAITACTRSLAVVISQSTRRVSVFSSGQLVFTLETSKLADSAGA